MITKEELIQIGRIVKPHGVRGELTFEFSTDVFDESDVPFFVCEVEGIFVPFFVENYRFKNNTMGLVKFEDIDSEEDAKELTKVNLYLSRSLLPAGFSEKEAQGLDFYIGYSIVNQEGEMVGTIDFIDDSTENVLFCLSSPSGKEILIPASDDYILDIDENARKIRMEILEGLLEL